MSFTVSRPIRIFALVALIAALGGAAMLSLQKRHNGSAPVVSTSPATAATASRPSSSAPLTSRTARTAKPATPAKKRAPVVAPNGLPTTIADALRSHMIVVVSVSDPQSSTDAISYAEAKAGAAEAGVGFVGVSVLDNPVAGALTSVLPGGGLLPEPGVLIYRRPDTLVQLINGFADRDVVAQAAAASKTAPALTRAGS